MARGRTNRASEKLTTFLVLSLSRGKNLRKLDPLYADQTVQYSELIKVMRKLWFEDTALDNWHELTKNY